MDVEVNYQTGGSAGGAGQLIEDDDNESEYSDHQTVIDNHQSDKIISDNDHDTSESDNGKQEEEEDEVNEEVDETDEESIADKAGDEQESEDQNQEDDDESSMSDNDDAEGQGDPEYAEEDEEVEDSPKISDETRSTETSPQQQHTRGRGRPKKILKDDDILNALDVSYQNTNDEESEEEEEDDEEDESPPKRSRYEEDENIRRSGRERKAPKKFEVVVPDRKKRRKKSESSDSEPEQDSDDSDYYSKKKRSKKSKKKKDKSYSYKKGSPTKVTRKKKKVVSEEEDDGEDDESDNEYSRSWKNREKKNKRRGIITAADYGDKKSSRARKTVTKYQEEDTSHESDVASDYDEAAEAEEVAEEDVENVESVLDHRTGRVGATGEQTMFWNVKENGDPNDTLETEEREEQFLIKWKGWSHINNTWESESSLEAKKKGSQEVKGLRRVYNYQQKLGEYNRWKKFANPEDVEYQEIELEMKRQLLNTYIEVERIFSQRKNENNSLDYYVKWRNLSYAEASWEDETVISSYYDQALEEYNTRRKARCNPRSYKESMKFFKKTFKPLKEQPSFIGSDSLRLRDYQLDGLNFMLKAWHRGDSLILADEMGLGKTIQSISFLKYLFHVYPFKGPMLVIVPLSTMAAWQKEFSTWAPEINTICYNGSGPSREVIRQFECENTSGELTFNALLTNYEMVCKDRTFFQDIIWSNIVVDEAHRLKNKESLLYNVLTTIDSHHRLLLTGTPLQNSLKELWCLLSYLQLDVDNIESWEAFEANYGTVEERAAGYSKLHSLLKPYIIRRMKKDVEKSLPPKVEQILRVDMTVRQKKVYKHVLTRNYDALSRGKNQVSLINIMMQLRKTCNHVELLQDQEEMATNSEDRLKQLIYGSGKLLLLDKLLSRFREKGDRVLVFSQMVSMLNLLEDYMQLKRFPYQRLDGGVSADKRKHSIAQFNDPSSHDFCFLLSTKAGGLGINLQTANRVVIFDSDWNPQNDLQAIARAHRIGQKEEVKIFRFVASSSVDEDIIHRAKKKMVLDHLVIQSMDTTGKAIINGGKEDKKGNVPFDKNELNMILKFGAEDLFKTDEDQEQDKEVDLDAILESAELREEDEAPQSEANKELLSAFKCTNIAFDEDEETEEPEEQNKDDDEPVFKDWSDIIPSAMVEKEKQKEKKGIDMYSDPEELFNPIAMRKRKRVIKKKADEESSVPNSAVQSKDNSEAEQVDDDNGNDDSVDSDMSDGERQIIDTLKKRGYKRGETGRKYSKKTVKCLQCDKAFVARKALKQHMKNIHKVEDFKFTPANNLSTSEVKVLEQGAARPVAPELLVENNNVGKKKRGPPPANTRCFPCNKSFKHRPGYKLHIKNKHDGVEPPENLDPKNLALPDDRISCLICGKKYTSTPGLKGHIQIFHLGLNSKAAKDTEDDDDEDPLKLDEEDTKPAPGNNVTDAEAAMIEKMYYAMRKYGCTVCTVRFNNKSKLVMHESVHAKSKNKPVICPYCEKSYSKRDKLKNHIEKFHPGKPMPAPGSSSSSPAKTPTKIPIKTPVKVTATVTAGPCNQSRLKIIKVNKDGKEKHQCPHCKKLFTYRKGCIRHVKQFHSNVTSPQKPALKKKAPAKQEVIDVPDDDDVEEIDDEEPPAKTVDSSTSLAPRQQMVNIKSKEYTCPVCEKPYASYMSLYMHKKSKHPDIPAKGGTNSNILAGLTPNNRREKIHQCNQCQKR